MNFNGLATAIAGTIFALQASAQPSPSLTLANAVEAAIQQHPSLRSAQLGVDLAEIRIDQTEARRLPSIRLSETITRGNNPVFVFGSLLEQSRFGPQNFALDTLNSPRSLTNMRTSITADFHAFDGLKTPAEIAQARIGRNQAVLQKTLAAQGLRFEVVRHYFGVLLAQAALGVAEEAARMAEADARRAGDRLDAGIGVRSELLSAQVQLAEFRQQQIQSEGEVASAVAALNIAMGQPPGTQHTLKTQLVPRKFDVAALDRILNEAIQNRADSQLAEMGIEFADRRIAERRSSLFPDINVFASLGTSGRSVTTGSADYSFGAGLTFNLFDPGRAAGINEAQLQKDLARTERDRVLDRIRIEIVGAYHAYRAAEGRLAVAEASLAQAVEALRIVQDRYEAGLTTIVDLLRAETATVRARMNVVESRHGQYTGYASLLLAAGKLDDVRIFDE